MFRIGRSAVVGVVVAAGAIVSPVGFGELEAQSRNVTLTVLGNSTIRSWSCDAPGSIAITPGSGSQAALPGLPQGVASAVLTVPVKDMKCPDDGMTEHLMEAMHPDRNPTISFVLSGYTFAGSSARAQGELTINGVTRSVEFPIQVENGEFHGEPSINMTEYGVTPPVVLLGALRVRPVVRVRFRGSLR